MTGDLRSDAEGNPILKPPHKYEFRWTRSIIEDLLGGPKGPRQPPGQRRRRSRGRGRLTVYCKIFDALRQLRDRNQTVASALLDHLVSDIFGEGGTVEKDAVKVFIAIGLNDPGPATGEKLGNRYAEHVETVARAVCALKEAGVLEASSDDRPRQDPNDARRKRPYYRWKRTPKFTPSPRGPKMIDAVVTPVAQIEPPQPPPKPPQPPPKPPQPPPEPPQPDLFGHTDRPSPRGRDIRAAREAAGLTLRDFKTQFGGSIGLWSQVEQEVIARRTGRPKEVPAGVRDQVAKFVEKALREKAEQNGHEQITPS